MVELIELDSYLENQVKLGMDGADILHGHLKTLMYEAEQRLQTAVEAEEDSGEAMDSMERTYAEGYLDALTYLYGLTYAIAFAKEENNE